MNSKYFEAPEQFVPERWLRKSDNYTPIHPFSYIPFGYGARKCIGQTFAETEISVCAAKVKIENNLSVSKNLRLRSL